MTSDVLTFARQVIDAESCAVKGLAQLIDEALTLRDDATLGRIAGEVHEMTRSFPLYPPVARRHRALQTA